MKVLHIGKYFPPHRGGMETFLRDLMVEQQRQGLNVTALVHQSDRSLSSSDEIYIWREARLAITRVGRWATMAFAPISPLFIWHLWRLVARDKPDVLHLHMPNTSVFWCLLLPSVRRLPWIVQWQSDVLASPLKASLRWLYWLYSWPEKLVLRRAEAIIASSPNYLESSRTLSRFKNKCTVIPLAIDVPSPSVGQAREVPHRSNDNLLSVLAVGRLTYYKGFDVLIRALPDCPYATVQLVGEGEERASLQALAKELGVLERISFLGGCDDQMLEGLYHSSDLLCLPSIERTESFGIVLLEAMSRGLPCVVSDVPGSGMGWVVGGPDSGALVPPGDPISLAEMLNRLAADRGILTTVSAAMKQRFDERFTLSSCVHEISKLYSTAACGSK